MPVRSTFGGARYSVERLFGGLSTNETLLYAGGVMLRRRGEEAHQLEEVHGIAREFLARHHGSSSESFELSVDNVYFYETLFCIDFKSPWGYEVGVYDRSTRVLEETFWNEGVMGQLVAISATTGATSHRLIVNFDAQRRSSISMHTFQEGAVEEGGEKKIIQPLRILTYNIWNVNPPAYMMRSPAARWKHYSERMAFLCEVIRAQDVDVLLLQEVRLDNSFRGADGSGSQLELLLSCLQLVEKRWQFIFAPAMSMVDKSTCTKTRSEEGLAILTRHAIDVVSIEVLLLPRNLLDGNDDHSRMVLRATVSTPGNHKVDVMTTHFPLSSQSRENAVDFISASAGVRDSPFFQVLSGDLNAEPNDACLQSLQSGSRPFVDAWAETADADEGFTFPACRPVKRIDYVLVRNASASSGCGAVRSVAIVGHRSKEEEEIAERIATKPETGMLDDDSLLWASDHYALRTDLLLLRECDPVHEHIVYVSDEL